MGNISKDIKNGLEGSMVLGSNIGNEVNNKAISEEENEEIRRTKGININIKLGVIHFKNGITYEGEWM